ncbi:hypothetical protein FNF31_07940 [Cafeteria roenbergensis]|uniref:Uncharacterized protein n=1 Tax=Cafeteria roenbergensis TaxID=33653 RepID=A0A5A8BYH9_CAFRO|nr:hypothetical protein FNF31_07940 [Cafeteria roenbergensis]
MVRRDAVTYGPATLQFDGTALVRAACGGHKDTVELLLDRGANLEAKDFFDGTALVQAARGGHKDTVELLLDRGANLEANGLVSAAVVWCCATGHARRHGWAGGMAMAMMRRGVVLLWRAGV